MITAIIEQRLNIGFVGEAVTYRCGRWPQGNEIHRKYRNAICGQSVEFLSVETSGK